MKNNFIVVFLLVLILTTLCLFKGWYTSAVTTAGIVFFVTIVIILISSGQEKTIGLIFAIGMAFIIGIGTGIVALLITNNYAFIAYCFIGALIGSLVATLYQQKKKGKIIV